MAVLNEQRIKEAEVITGECIYGCGSSVRDNEMDLVLFIGLNFKIFWVCWSLQTWKTNFPHFCSPFGNIYMAKRIL